MKSSAKVTVFSLLAVSALGGAVLVSGCTVSSTTDPNVDGGTSSSTSGSGSSSTSGSGSSSGGTEDAGDGGVALACEGNMQKEGFAGPPGMEEACQPCLEQKCCSELKTCFNQAVEQGTQIDCDQYATDYQNCGDDADCLEGVKAATHPDIPAAYDAIVSCGTTNCSAECGFQ